MLNENEQKYIKTNGWMIDHDWLVYSSLLGEPFLINNLLCYWNRKHLALCSWPLEKDISESQQRDQILATVLECERQFKPLTIEVWGPMCVRLDQVLPDTFRLLAFRPPSDKNINLQIDFSQYSFPQRSRFFQRAANEKRLELRIHDKLLYAWYHYEMICHFITRHSNLREFDRALINLAPTFSCARNVKIFEVLMAAKVIGLAIVREALNKTAIVTWFLVGRERRVSDFLMKNVIEYYKKSKFRYLDFGYSVNEGLLSYKLKWRCNINNGSYCDYIYADEMCSNANEIDYWWLKGNRFDHL